MNDLTIVQRFIDLDGEDVCDNSVLDIIDTYIELRKGGATIADALHTLQEQYEAVNLLEFDTQHYVESIAEEINNLTMEGFDTLLVTCGKCGGICNQLMCQQESNGDITCPYCEFVSEPCGFPDLFY